jgi:trehalose 6-phosphate synthase/phosphatase
VTLHASSQAEHEHGFASQSPLTRAGVKPQRYIEGFEWPDTKWRIGELTEQLRGCTVLLGFDDLDAFKGIEMKLLAFEQVLDYHEDWRGRLVLVQVTSPPRSNSKETQDLADFIKGTADRINKKYGDSRTGFMPLIYEERPVPLHDRLALFSLAHCVVVTATRDGMNLVPYEYIVCRQGAPGLQQRTSTLVVSGTRPAGPHLPGHLPEPVLHTALYLPCVYAPWKSCWLAVTAMARCWMSAQLQVVELLA